MLRDRSAVRILGGIGLAVPLLVANTAFAEVTLGKAKGWEAFTTGNVSAFFTHANGDGYPVAPLSDPMRTFVDGGGLPTKKDSIPNEKDAMGNPAPGDAGYINKWRVRSGYLPNILGFGVRSQLSEDLKLKGFVAVWGTIETDDARKYVPIQADFREAYLNLSGSWGAVTAGRTLSLFSRGTTEMAMLYGHRYGVGFHPAVGDVGPTGGMVGFGVLASSYNPGVYYTTPSLAGIRLNIGVFDGVQMASAWNRTETPRPEGELTYDLSGESLKVHVYANGAFQKLYKSGNAKDSATIFGTSGGVRLEVGGFHFGGGAYYGRGVGMFYAFDDTAGASTGNEGFATLFGPSPGTDPTSGAELNKPYEPRTFDGVSAFAQYSADKFDINIGAGQSRAHLLAIDKVLPASLIKTQTGLSLGFVWHLSKNLHADVDYMRAMFRWYKGDKQNVNFINAGATIDW